MAEPQGNKSKRDQVGERLKNKYPDREWADDEALFGQINDDYDEYEKTLKEKTDAEDRLTEMFTRYPHSARFITDMANGKEPWAGMVEQIGIDGITDMFDNPEYKEELAKAQEAYVQRLAKEKDLEEEYQKNLGESLTMLETAQSELGLSDEQLDAAVDLLMQIANDAIVGKFSRESVEMALKALNHDSDIAAAREEGTIAGRNAKIEEKLRKSKKGDGVPTLGGRNNGPGQEKRNLTIFDYANAAK